jgi:hypothetical protein
MTNTLDTEEYLDLVNRIVAKDKASIEKYASIGQEYLFNNSKYFEEVYSFVSLNKKVYNYLGEINQKLNWVLITEPWCGDASFSTPYIMMLAQSNELISLKIALRDDNEDLINQYLTNGGKSIPILVCFDEQNNFLFKWGPRPAICQELVNSFPKEFELKDKIEKIYSWYKEDKGEQVQLEIFELLKKHIK